MRFLATSLFFVGVVNLGSTSDHGSGGSGNVGTDRVSPKPRATGETSSMKRSYKANGYTISLFYSPVQGKKEAWFSFESNEEKTPCEFVVYIPPTFVEDNILEKFGKNRSWKKFDQYAERLEALRFNGCIDLDVNNGLTKTYTLAHATPVVEHPKHQHESGKGNKKNPMCKDDYWEHNRWFKRGDFGINEKTGYDTRHFKHYEMTGDGQLMCFGGGVGEGKDAARKIMGYKRDCQDATGGKSCTNTKSTRQILVGDDRKWLPWQHHVHGGLMQDKFKRDDATVLAKIGDFFSSQKMKSGIDQFVANTYCYIGTAIAIEVFDILGISFEQNRVARRTTFGDLSEKFVKGFFDTKWSEYKSKGVVSVQSGGGSSASGDRELGVVPIENLGGPNTTEPFRWIVTENKPLAAQKLSEKIRKGTIFKESSIVFVDYREDRICRLEIPMPTGYMARLSESLTRGSGGSPQPTKRQKLQQLLLFGDDGKSFACIDIDGADKEMAKEDMSKLPYTPISSPPPSGDSKPVTSPEFVSNITRHLIKSSEDISSMSFGQFACRSVYGDKWQKVAKALNVSEPETAKRSGREIGNILMYKIGEFGYPQSEIFSWEDVKKKFCRVVVHRAMKVIDIVYGSKLLTDAGNSNRNKEVVNFLFPGNGATPSYQQIERKTDSPPPIDDKPFNPSFTVEIRSNPSSIMFLSKDKNCRLEIPIADVYQSLIGASRESLEIYFLNLEMDVCVKLTGDRSPMQLIGVTGEINEFNMDTRTGKTVNELVCSYTETRSSAVPPSKKRIVASFITTGSIQGAARDRICNVPILTIVKEIYKILDLLESQQGSATSLSSPSSPGEPWKLQTSWKQIDSSLFVPRVVLKSNSVVFRSYSEEKKCRIEIALPTGTEVPEGKMASLVALSVAGHICPPATFKPAPPISGGSGSSGGVGVSTSPASGALVATSPLGGKSGTSTLESITNSLLDTEIKVGQLVCSEVVRNLMNWIVAIRSGTEKSAKPFGDSKAGEICQREQVSKFIESVYAALFGSIGNMGVVLSKPFASLADQTSESDSQNSETTTIFRPRTVIVEDPAFIVYQQYSKLQDGSEKLCRLEIALSPEYQAILEKHGDRKDKLQRLRFRICPPFSIDDSLPNPDPKFTIHARDSVEVSVFDEKTLKPGQTVAARELACLIGDKDVLISLMVSPADMLSSNPDDQSKLCNKYIFNKAYAVVQRTIYGDNIPPRVSKLSADASSTNKV